MWSQPQLRRNASKFKLMASAVGNTKKVPVSTKFVIKNIAAVGAVTAWGTVNGSNRSIPASPAGKYRVVDSLPADSTVKVNANFELYIDKGLGGLLKIITGS